MVKKENKEDQDYLFTYMEQNGMDSLQATRRVPRDSKSNWVLTLVIEQEELEE